MSWRVTHVDAQHRRHLLDLPDTTRAAAEALAMAMWGPAVYLAAVRRAG
jgi:hypothetical protein